MRPSSVVATSGFVGFFVEGDAAVRVGGDDFEAAFGAEAADFLGFDAGVFVAGAGRRRFVGSRSVPSWAFFLGRFGESPVAVTRGLRCTFRENE
ncbi:MAG: hypothetical protein H6721_06630 [Sandaracinus sp.]|nr:hypothetical protein [Sandaracinus sp.]MCB9631798.1 hypothetical protein [Sandaracinus sp.]